MKVIIPTAICIVLTVFACDSNKDEEKNKVRSDNTEWERIEAHQKYTAPELIEAYPEDSLGYTFEADYSLLSPKSKDGTHYPFLDSLSLYLISRLDTTLDATKKETPQVLLDQYVGEKLNRYKFMIKNSGSMFEDGYGSYAFIETHSLTDSLVYDNDGLVSILSDWWAFTGGAHGNWGHYATNIDFNTAKILSDTALFAEGSEGEINRLLLSTLMKDLGVSDIQVLKDSIYINPDAVVMNGNFYFQEDGITYIYQPYEIAPYANGETFVHLPYSVLAPFLKEEYVYLAD